MRRFLSFLLALTVLAGLAVAALPWWLGLALEPMARSQGLTFSRYERLSYGRFRLHEVRYTRPGVEVTASRVDAGTPLLWLVSPTRRQAVVDEWSVTIRPGTSSAEPPTRKITGLPGLHDLLLKVAAGIDRWLPHARLGAGEVSWPHQTLRLAGAEWRNRTLTVAGLAWRDQLADVTLGWPVAGPVSLRAKATDWQTQLTWSGPTLQGTGAWLQQPWKIEAQFPAERWVPSSADLQAENWQVDAGLLKLGADYTFVRGSTHVAWSDDHFELSANAKAIPRDDAKSAPPIEARVEARGNTQSATITALHVAAPFATAELSEPVTLDFARGFQAGSARLSLDADLARLPWVQARGTAKGIVEVGGDRRQSFALEFADIHFREVDLKRATARGTLEWPRLELTELDAQWDDGNRLTGRGSIDLVAREITGGKIDAELTGATWLARWLPAGLQWTKATLAAVVSGPVSAPVHSGKVVVTQFLFAPVRPMDLTLEWQGRGGALDPFALQAAVEHATFSATGALDEAGLRLQSANLAKAGREPWTLAGPAHIAWGRNLAIESVRFGSADGFVFVQALDRAAGRLQLNAVNFDSALLQDWIALPGPEWKIATLNLTGETRDNFLTFTAQLAGQVTLSGRQADLRLHAHGDREGIQVDELATTLGGRVVTHLTGNIPIAWDARLPSQLQVGWDRPFALEAETTPDSPLWTLLADFAGVAVDRPVATIKLNGTLAHPEGELNIQAARVAATRPEYRERIPEVTGLSLRAHADDSGLTIDTFTARIDEQQISARGQLPLGVKNWGELRKDPADFIWRHGQGHIELADADLARLARRAPDFLAAQGRLSASLDLASGGLLTGELHLRGAALRPIDPLGVVQEINADLALVDRQLEIKSWSAKLGGEPVEVRGTIELPLDGKPRVALELKGQNLPLVRRTGLIVRCDLALAARTNGNDKTQVTGTVLLRDTVVLADLSVLRPTGRTTARRQPPYFSVEVEPFRDWTLGVDLRGPRAIRVRTPVFHGVASARFRLGGTLGEPRAVGEVTVDEGRVLFPFATFNVQLGAIRLSEADPYHPQLNVNAQARYHDYLLRLEATGPLESPHVLLSSNPSLEAAQLLLMVTSGQSPETDQAAATGSQRLARLGTYLGQGLILGSGSEASRIELSSGSRVSRQGRETYEFTYRLDERWALVGEYDEYDEYNAGVKWRAYVQEGEKSEKK